MEREGSQLRCWMFQLTRGLSHSEDNRNLASYNYSRKIIILLTIVCIQTCEDTFCLKNKNLMQVVLADLHVAIYVSTADTEIIIKRQ